MWTVCLCVCPNNNKLSTFLFVFWAAAASFASFSSTSCFYAALTQLHTLTQLHIHWLGVRWKPFRSTFSVLTRYLFCISLCFFLSLPLSLLSLHTGASWLLFTRAKKHTTLTNRQNHTHTCKTQSTIITNGKKLLPLAVRIAEVAGERRTGNSHAVATRITATVTTTERRESTWNHNPCVGTTQ